MEPRFQKLEDKLNSIKRLNDSFGGKQLLFYSLEDSEGSGGGDKAQGALDMSSSLLEAIVQVSPSPNPRPNPNPIPSRGDRAGEP